MTTDFDEHPSSPELTAATFPSAGWYPDPAGSSDERWWDGNRWMDSTRARTRLPSSAAQPASRNSVDASGPSKATTVNVAIIALLVVGLVLQLRDVSLLTGDSVLITGGALIFVGTVLALWGRARRALRVIAVLALIFAIANTIVVEKQLSDKRGQIQQIFNN